MTRFWWNMCVIHTLGAEFSLSLSSRLLWWKRGHFPLEPHAKLCAFSIWNMRATQNLVSKDSNSGCLLGEQTMKWTVWVIVLAEIQFRAFLRIGGYESKIPLGGAIDQEINETVAGTRSCLWSFPCGEKDPANDLCFPQILCDGTILDMPNLNFSLSSDYVGCPDRLGR